MSYIDINAGDTGSVARTKINGIGSGLDVTNAAVDVLEESISYFSTGVFGEQAVLTDNGNGTATINEVTVLLYATSDFTGILGKYTVAGDTFTFTDGAEEYVTVKYNSGSPVMYLETVLSNINNSDNTILFTCWRQGTTIHSVNFDSTALGLSNKINTSLYRTELYKLSRDGGMMIYETTSPNPRTITSSSAVVYMGAIPQNVATFSSATDTMTFAYHTSGSWTYTNNLVYNNTSYDNGIDLANIPLNKYGVFWFYRSIGDIKQIFYVAGTTYYNKLSDTTESLPRTDLPLLLQHHCMLIGRGVVQRNATSGYVESAFGISFFGTPTVQHNDTLNIQGGTTAEYYHLTAAEHSKISGSTRAAVFGTATDNTTFELDGTMVMTGSATVWDDIFFPLVTAKQGQADKPAFSTTEVAYLFPSADTSQLMYIVAQFPHSRKLGSSLDPHVHWKQTQSGSVVFKMDYKWFPIGGSIPATWSTHVMNIPVIPYTSGSMHQLTHGTMISGSIINETEVGVSSIMLIKLYRDDNTYTGNAVTYQFDIHFEKDSIGSRQEYIK